MKTAIDLGGNTGEFALQICRRQPMARAVVGDLPVVCELGRRHIGATATPDEAARIRFQPIDFRRDGPQGLDLSDLVTFKSVLHDWPEAEAAGLLRRGAALVRPGGRLVIFERLPLDLSRTRLTYAMLPDLMFLHFLRDPEVYVSLLTGLGFREIRLQRIELEVSFFLLEATRP